MKQKRVKIPFGQSHIMVASYASARFRAQIKAVAFVVVYLVLAQTFVLRVPVQNALSAAIGVGATVAGLAFFLEGLLLGVMPLGEQCGLRLPPRAGAVGVAFFALVIGVTATLAEPAIGFLKMQGGAATAWDAPLLYFLLNRKSGWLVMTIASGVGVSVLLGVFRFLYGWGFKPSVFIVMPVLAVASFFFEYDPVLGSVVGLAWDTGGVTTGPVTVPLVIALGLGVAKVARGGKGSGASGLGVITLASALPVAAVFILALAVSPHIPAPSAFFLSDMESRAKAEFVAGSRDKLAELGRDAVKAGALTEEAFSARFPGTALAASGDEEGAQEAVAESEAALTQLKQYAKDALSSVLPLSGVLVAVLLLIVRERIRNLDEVLLGLAFTIVGMTLFGIGMNRGISELGRQAGEALPRTYRATEQAPVLLKGVSETSVFTVPGPEGGKPYIWLGDGDKSPPKAVPYDESKLDAETHVYRHVPVTSAVFGEWGETAGQIAALIFVFILGFGATFAEPSLAALGMTVEEITTGTYRKTTLVANVAVGVGFGMAAGFACILYKIPLSWMLAIPYAVALLLTVFSSEEFAAIAWDSAGVTTGPVTVPLVIAAGLGIGKEAGVADAFGVVATASVFPILAVLVSGILTQIRAKGTVRRGKGAA